MVCVRTKQHGVFEWLARSAIYIYIYIRKDILVFFLIRIKSAMNEVFVNQMHGTPGGVSHNLVDAFFRLSECLISC